MALEVRPDNMKRIDSPALAQAYVDERIGMLREQIGDKRSCWPSPAAWTPRSSPRC